MARHFLVLGAGSVGKRHMENLARLGCELSAMDPRQDRLDEASAKVPLRVRATSLSAPEIAGGTFDGVVIGSPPKFHVEQTEWALDRSLPVLLEKPLCKDLAGALRIQQAVERTRGRVLLGYTYRWWGPLRDLQRRVRAGEVGRVLHVQCTMSAHLADWHPWEPYNAFFMASADLGGGALLDESHFIDLMVWLFGTPTAVRGSVARLGPLEIETDDTVDALLEFKDGPRCLIHLDLYGRPHEKWIRITGDKGSLHWSFDPNEVRVAHDAAQEWTAQRYDLVRNDMFVECAREFLGMVDGRAGTSTCTVEDGVATMRVIEALRRSEASGAREVV